MKSIRSCLAVLISLFCLNAHAGSEPPDVERGKAVLLNSILAVLKIEFRQGSGDIPPHSLAEDAVQEAAAVIKSVARQIPAGYSFFVIGHAFREGTENDNRELAAARARAVFFRLWKLGVPPEVPLRLHECVSTNMRAVTFEVREHGVPGSAGCL